jgi:hypothetical protein
MQASREESCILDEYVAVKKCRVDLAAALSKMGELGDVDTALVNAHHLMVLEFDTIFPTPHYDNARPANRDK